LQIVIAMTGITLECNLWKLAKAFLLTLRRQN